MLYHIYHHHGYQKTGRILQRIAIWDQKSQGSRDAQTASMDAWGFCNVL